MSDSDRSGPRVTGTVTGDVSGQVAIGSNVQQIRTEGVLPSPDTQALMLDFHSAVEQLRAEIRSVAPPELAGPAQERVDELEAAVASAAAGEEEVDLTTFEYVRNWLGKHLPAVAGAVTSVVVHPLVGKLVEAAGDAAAGAIKRRME